MLRILLLVKVNFLAEPDRQAVALYSFHGAPVEVGKWLRASTQLCGQIFCIILNFYS